MARATNRYRRSIRYCTQGIETKEDRNMELVTATSETAAPPQGVLSIDQKRPQRPASKALSKAVSQHLEGKRESAARTLAKAIQEDDSDPALYVALGHIQYEMQDYESAASTYEKLAGLDQRHRTAHFNLGVCQGNLKNWKSAADAFCLAAETDATRA